MPQVRRGEFLRNARRFRMPPPPPRWDAVPPVALHRRHRWPAPEPPPSLPAPGLGTRPPPCYRRSRKGRRTPCARTAMEDVTMSRTGLPHDVVVYPCSDGQPMAETELHGACMVYVAQALRRLVRDPRASGRVRRLEQLPLLRAGQSPGGGVAGRVRGGGSARRVFATRTCCGTSPRGRTSCWR